MPFLECSREKTWMFPPTLEELVSDKHEVRFVADFVACLNLRELGIDPEPAVEGRPSFPPRVLLACLLYGFMTRVRSTRKLEQACRERLPFMWLTAMTRPDHNTIWEFYQENRKAMKKLFKKSVLVAIKLGMVGLAEHALDGSKILASAAKDRTFDKKGLEELDRKIQEQIDDLERQNKDEDGRHSERSGELPAKLRKAGALKSQVGEAMQALAVGEKEKVNLTDGDARFMKTTTGLRVAYNGQVVVEGKSGIIVAEEVVDEPGDNEELLPMLHKVKENLGANAEHNLADGGYFGGENLVQCAKEGLEVVMPEPQAKRKKDSPEQAYHKSKFAYDPEQDIYRCPQGEILTLSHTGKDRDVETWTYRGRGCKGCAAREQCTKDRKGRTLKRYSYDGLVVAHRQKMKEQPNKSLSKLRKQIVEPVFGIIKEQMDGRRFLLRGLGNVRGEWSLLCTAYNLRKIFRAWQVREEVPCLRVVPSSA